MKYKNLGARGPVVSTIGFGAWAIGGMNWGATDDQVSKKALHTALDYGVTLIDTADVYGFGHSEELIAAVLEERGGKGNVIVATKAGNDFYDASDADNQGYGAIRPNYQKQYLCEAVERSLRRLRVDAVDILQLHSPGMDILAQDEPWDALHSLKRDGKILHAGLSIKSFEETIQAPLLDAHHDILDVIQVRYNLLEREAERVLFPKALEYGIGVIVRIPILFGLLSGKFNRDRTFGDDDHRKMNLSPEKLSRYLDQFELLRPLFTRNASQSMAQVSLRFCLTHPACSTAIPGAKSPHQVLDNVAASDLGGLTTDDLALLQTGHAE